MFSILKRNHHRANFLKTPLHKNLHNQNLKENMKISTSALLSNNFCWLHGYSLYFAFLVPVGLVLVFNALILYMVVRKSFWKREEIQSSRQKATKLEQLIVAIIIAFTIGLTWVFGYLMLLSEKEIYFIIFNAIFTFFVSFQGFGLFLLLCVRNTDARMLWWPFVREWLNLHK